MVIGLRNLCNLKRIGLSLFLFSICVTLIGQTPTLTYSTSPNISSAAFSGFSLSVAGEVIGFNAYGFTLSIDGTKMYITGSSGEAFSNDIFEYSLSTPFDISSATHVGTFDVNSLDTGNSQAVKVSNDGTKIFITGDNNVIEFDLSTPYDITSATKSNTLDLSSIAGFFIGLDFNNSGTRMYITEGNSSIIYQFNLSSGFDLSTSTSSFTSSLNVSGSDLFPSGLAFNQDGSGLYFYGRNNDLIYEYNLSTPFSLPSGIFKQNFMPSQSETEVFAIDFNDTNTKLYLFDAGTQKRIYEYNLSSNAFTEAPVNDGSVEGSLIVSLRNDTFANAGGTLTSPTHFTINNLPAGLTPSITVSGDGLTATLILTGNATTHEDANDVSDLQFTFTDAAFTTSTAAVVNNAIGASTNLGVDFDDNITTITSFTPTTNATNIARNTNITLIFDANINQATIDNSTAGDPTDDNIVISGDQTGIIAGTYTGDGTATITFDPAADFKPGELISVTVTSGVQSTVGGAAVAEAFQFNVTSGLAPGTFQGENTISTTAAGATFVYATDVDGDGDMDVLSASFLDNKIAWYENNGSQVFTERVISTTADGARSAYATDVDGDGDMDVLSAFFTDDKIAWYENDGSQVFTERVISTTSNGAQSVYATDVDGDGDMDVLSASFFDDKIAWYENNGSQVFTERVISTTADGAWSVYATDVDGDGDMDVLSASRLDDKIAWYENNGSQVFTERVISTTADAAESVYATDVDGDGDMDVLSASELDDKIAWYENNGGQVFTERVISTTADAPQSVYATDVDGDGDMDVLSASESDDKIAWYENNGGQVFTERVISTTADGARSVYAVDVDGDGDMDVLSASFFDDKIAWYEQIPPPTITSFSPTSGPVGTSVTITGTNFDATPANNIVFFGATQATVNAATTTNLNVTVPVGATYQPITVLTNSLIAYSASPFVVTFISDGAGIDANSFDAKVDFTTGTNPRSVAIGDLDGDGKVDLAVANEGGNTVSVFMNTSTGAGTISYAPKVDFGTLQAPFSVSIGDLDGDGKSDLAITNNSSSTLSVFRNTSTGAGFISYAAQVDLTTGSTPRTVSIGDLDGDGKADLAVVNESGTVSVFRNTTLGAGSISYASKVDFPTGSTPSSASIGDFDGDGKADLVVANFSSNFVSVLRNTSTGAGSISYAPKVDFTIEAGSWSVSVGDLDGDGKVDLAVANETSNMVSVFRNTSTMAGSISFAPKVDYATGLNPQSLSIGDLDGDGRADLAVGNQGSPTVSVFRNTGTSPGTISYAPKVDYTIASTSSVSIGDLDGDGKADLAVANGSNTVSVLRNAICTPPVIDQAKIITTNLTSCSPPRGILDATDPLIVTTAIGEPVAGYTFDWWNGNTATGSADFTGTIYSNLVAGDYTLVATNNDTGCPSAPVIFTVTENIPNAVLGTQTAASAPSWYKYTASANFEKLLISSVGLTTVNTNLFVFSDCAQTLLIGSSDDDSNSPQSSTEVDVSPNETIYIFWDNTHSSSGFDWSINIVPYLPVSGNDSLALVSLYNTNNGVNWNTRRNWLSGPVDSWWGITTSNGRVTNVHLGGNNLSGDITPDLGNLDALQTLGIRDNPNITSIPDLSSFIELFDLNLANTAIQDFPGLSSLTGLTGLDLSGLALNSLPDLSSIINLNTFAARENNLSDLSAVTSIVALQHLNVGDNDLNVTPDFSLLINLTELNIDDIGLTALPSLSTLSQLEQLNVNNNNLTDISALSAAPASLARLFISNNQLTDLSAINAATGLVELDIGGNYIATYPDFSLLTSLQVLTMRSVGSTTLPDLSASNLIKLDIVRNDFSDLSSLTSAGNLDDLNVWNNRLDFDDLEPFISKTIFNYSPQRSKNVIYRILNPGDNFTMDFFPPGSSLTFEWFKDGNSIGIFGNTQLVNNFQAADQGIYEVRVNSALLPGLTITQAWNLEIAPTGGDLYLSLVTTGAIAEAIPAFNYGSFWIDYDNDGDEDLYVNQWLGTNPQPNYFYENNGDGTFTKIVSGEIANTWGGRMVSWGDYNNDSHIDLLVPQNNLIPYTPGNRSGSRAETAIYKNNGDGTFTRIVVEPVFDASRSAVWGDYNNDGLLDIFRSTPGSRNKTSVLENNGDDTFTETSIISSSLSTDWAITTFDADNDFDIDFLMNTAAGNNIPHLYTNDGAGNFTETKLLAQANFYRGGAWADFDNDGDIDIFLPVQDTAPDSGKFVINDGLGNFTEVAMNSILGESFNARGATFSDIDNDGYLDLISTHNGIGKVALFINNQDGTFSRVPETDQFFTNSTIFGGVSTADYDNDGFLDLYVGTLDINRASALYRNAGNSNNWLKIKLEGTQSNRSAIGARVVVNTGTLQMTRYILPQTGFVTQNSLLAHFGLGTATTVNSVAVYWPSGIVQVINNVAADQTLTIIEELDLGVSTVLGNPSCADNNGTIAIGTTAGTNLTYSIDGGINFQPNNIFSSLASGNYSVVVKKNLGPVTNPLAVSLVIVPDSTWYRDSDSDNFGDALDSLVQCTQPVGFVKDNTDCDDGNPNIYPGAPGSGNNCLDRIKPVITPISLPTEITKGDGQINASIKATDNSGSVIVNFYYKEVRNASFTDSVLVTPDANLDYIQAIQESWLNGAGIDYFFHAEDISGNFITTDTTTLALVIPDSTAADIKNVLGQGGNPSDWRMFSIPYELLDKSITSIFENALGSPNGGIDWRLLHWDPTLDNFRAYQESSDGFSSLTTIDRGKGYWFNSRANIGIIIAGASNGTVLDPDNLFSMSLKEGWNQIGNPYPFIMSWDAVRTANGFDNTQIADLVVFSGSQDALVASNSNQIQAFQGAYVQVMPGVGDVNLSIPIVTGGRTAQSNEAPWGFDGLDQAAWQVALTLNAPGFSNQLGGIGMRPDASTAMDEFDMAKLPLIHGFPQLSFPSNTDDPSLTRSIIERQESYSWEFIIEALDGTSVSMKWENQYFGNNEFELILFDPSTSRIINMREVSDYEFKVYEVKGLEIHYGNSDYIMDKLSTRTVLLGRNFPNPLEHSTLIPFSLPNTSRIFNVILSIIDLQGRKLITLLDGKLPPGYYQVEWDLSENAGLYIKDGLYLYRIDIQSDNLNTSQSRTLIIK